MIPARSLARLLEAALGDRAREVRASGRYVILRYSGESLGATHTLTTEEAGRYLLAVRRGFLGRHDDLPRWGT